MQTLFHAITICVALFTLMAGVFTRPELVLEPGDRADRGDGADPDRDDRHHVQHPGAILGSRRVIDVLARLALAAVALVVLFHPDRQLAVLACIPVGLFVGYWVLRRRNAPAAAGARQGLEGEREVFRVPG